MTHYSSKLVKFTFTKCEVHHHRKCDKNYYLMRLMLHKEVLGAVKSSLFVGNVITST